MSILQVNNLKKEYPSFLLDNVTFSLELGRITGFVGRNGSGKTTTIKSMLNLIHPSSGEITYFNMPLIGHESEIKKRIGYSTGTVSWYPRKKLKDIVGVIKNFYPNWDENAYSKYIELFSLDENKTPLQLSEGMKVKFNLLLALSHKSEILILDEPTSGLDPFSRDELLDIFIALRENGTAIFYSTHIISDLEKCADDIVYISEGKIKATMSVKDFCSSFSLQGESLEQTILRLEKEKTL
ncbi:MAG: ABC transporter ATP-binding protein [Acutalibacteraceae bacterium]|nr:ABC transporter ATP-binding protein [Acutalibacteraceae bacterium]